MRSGLEGMLGLLSDAGNELEWRWLVTSGSSGVQCGGSGDRAPVTERVLYPGECKRLQQLRVNGEGLLHQDLR